MERCRPADLTCNLLDNPLAVPRRTPQLGWARGCRCGRHDRYRILVASSAGGLARQRADLWDSGWRPRDDALLVRYAGVALSSRQAGHWMVGLSDGDETLWSAPARFVTAPDRPVGRWVWASEVVPNQHLLLRGEVNLPQVEMEHAILSVSADDSFGLWADGLRLGRGPCPSFPAHQPYQSFDVTELVRDQERLTVAVHAHHLGLVNWAIVSGDGRAGVRAWLDVTTTDGTTTALSWDWRHLVCAAFPAGHVMGYDTAFTEEIDARELPVGWQQPGFDDHAWAPAVPVAAPDWTLVPQRTATVTEYRRHPESVEVTTTDGIHTMTVDFGRELVGGLGLRVAASATVLDVGLGEELTDDGAVRTQMRCNCRCEERWSGDGTERELQHYGDRAFRYAQVDVAATDDALPEVFANVAHYPFDGTRAEFDSSDPRLNRLWQLAVDSLRYGRQELMMDCPSRERANYGLDSLMMQHAAAMLDGEYVQGAHMAELLLESRVDGVPRAVAPASRDHHFTEYGLYPVLMVWLHHQHTGDVDDVRRWLPVLLEVVDAFATRFHVDGSSLIGGTDTALRDLVDWPTTMRDDHQMVWINSVPNAVHHRAVEVTGQLASIVGDDVVAEQLSRRAESIRTEFHDRLYDPVTERYRDGIDESGQPVDHSSLHSNVFALQMGLVPEPLRHTVGRTIADRGWRGNLFVGWFLLQVLFEYGAGEEALRALTDDTIPGPARMVSAGATTTWEAWDLDLKANSSLCHPAGAVIGAEMVNGLSGIRPIEPGHRRFRVRPRADLLSVCRLTVPTPYGQIEVDWQRSESDTTVGVIVPVGTTCIFHAPPGHELSGSTTTLELGPGCHRIGLLERGTPSI